MGAILIGGGVVLLLASTFSGTVIVWGVVSLWRMGHLGWSVAVQGKVEGVPDGLRILAEIGQWAAEFAWLK